MCFATPKRRCDITPFEYYRYVENSPARRFESTIERWRNASQPSYNLIFYRRAKYTNTASPPSAD